MNAYLAYRRGLTNLQTFCNLFWLQETVGLLSCQFVCFFRRESNGWQSENPRRKHSRFMPLLYTLLPAFHLEFPCFFLFVTIGMISHAFHTPARKQKHRRHLSKTNFNKRSKIEPFQELRNLGLVLLFWCTSQLLSTVLGARAVQRPAHGKD